MGQVGASNAETTGSRSDRTIRSDIGNGGFHSYRNDASEDGERCASKICSGFSVRPVMNLLKSMRLEELDKGCTGGGFCKPLGMGRIAAVSADIGVSILPLSRV